VSVSVRRYSPVARRGSCLERTKPRKEVLSKKSKTMAPPPPPPAKGPPPPPPRPTAPAAVSTDDAAGALFAEIAALGEGGVRSGLKKAVRGPVNTTAPEASLKPAPGPIVPKATAVVSSGEAKCELTGKKWQIEHQTGQKNLSVEGTLKQSVYIYKCTDSIIKVNGKVNAIVLDSCVKTSCVFDEVMVSYIYILSVAFRAVEIGETFLQFTRTDCPCFSFSVLI
jgi:adenylyl cyclase-associated protein